MSALRIRTQVDRLVDYINDLEKGKIQIPAFQRDFVWNNQQKLDLFDSIKKGYPIGSILFWQPDFPLDEDSTKFEVKEIGFYKIPTPQGDFSYVLDGYQRLSTLLGCLVHPQRTTLISTDSARWDKEFAIYYDLEADEFYFFKSAKKQDTIQKVQLYKFIDGKEFYDFQKKLYAENLPSETEIIYLQRFEHLSKMLQHYELPAIKIIGGSLSEAQDIFSRLNSKGAPIAADAMVSALSYNKEKRFKLDEAIDSLLNDLKQYNFDKLKRDTILNCIVSSQGKPFFDKSSSLDLEKLAKSDKFPEITKEALEGVKKAVQFLFEDCFVLDSKLIPYHTQLVFIAYFFQRIANPSQEQKEQLIDWFWITSFAGYFSLYGLSKQRYAFKKLVDFVDGIEKELIYYDKADQAIIVTDLPPKIDMGSARSKASALFMIRHACRGQNIDEIEGFKDYSLFEGAKNSIENTILVLKTERSEIPTPISKKETSSKKNFILLPIRSRRIKGVDYLLKSESDYSNYFITEKMKTDFATHKNQNRILDLRKDTIRQAEKDFVESLGMNYEDTSLFN